jgi:hypothetical protein
MNTTNPRAWIDANHVPMIRHDVPLDEAKELTAIMHQAFNAGVLKGIAQADFLRPPGRKTPNPFAYFPPGADVA